MKKLIIMLLAVVLAIPAINAVELSKKDQKRVESLAKNRAKELTKKGWETMGSLPLQSALEKHYTATEFGGCREQVGTSTKTKSKNNGRLLAQSNAMNEYAGLWASELQGRIVQDSKVNGVEYDEGEFENFYAAFQRLVESEIKGELQESVSMIRQNPDGTYEIQILYLVDEAKASDARVQAIKNAAKESKIAMDHAEEIANFVKNGK